MFPWDAFDVTSYDYGAPLSECGNYTDKYRSAAELIAKHDPLSGVLAKPDPPPFVGPVAYPTLNLDRFMPYNKAVSQVVSQKSIAHKQPKLCERLRDSHSCSAQEVTCTYPDLRPMEMLDCLNAGLGQSYGYVVYRKEVSGLRSGDRLKVKGRVHDLLIVMVNGVRVTRVIANIMGTLDFGSWGLR